MLNSNRQQGIALKYFMPTKIFFGENALAENSNSLRAMGSRALVVTDKDSARLSGAWDDLTKALKEARIEHALFDSVSENPSMETVESGAKFFEASGADFLIGVGGGSSIDAAKAVSAVAANKIACPDIYDPKKIRKAYPIVAIPTTSGTGTEATPFSVITDERKKRKAGFESEFIFPKIAFLDPKYTLSLGKNLTRNTVIDALSHLLEGLCSTQRNPILYPLIYDGVETIYHALIPTMQNPKDLLLREKLMRASFYGGIVIAHTSTTLQHAIGNPLTTEFGIPHGLANGIVMREIMELYYPAVKSELDELFSHLKISRDEFYRWLDSLGMRLENKLSDDFIEQSSQSVMMSGDIPISPVRVTQEIVKGLYERLREK